jgi:hypothetical protein
MVHLLSSWEIQWLLGQGDGTFKPAPRVAVGTQPASIAVADFNGDGKPDLAVANSGSNNISLMLGKGDGSFQPAENMAVGGLPVSIVVGDLNSDGKLDLAAANRNSRTLLVLLGKGDGSFQPAANIALDVTPGSIAVGDFNGDGKPDLVVTSVVSAVSIFASTGNGSFQAPLSFGVLCAAGLYGFLGVFTNGCSTDAAVVGDFNGDNKPDLAIVNQTQVTSACSSTTQSPLRARPLLPSPARVLTKHRL